jgi:ABC-type transport system involved in Fe-S cluster assembly fused permease/ATPase subunit
MLGAVPVPSEAVTYSQLAALGFAVVKSSTRWIVYSVFRVGLFAAALTAMLLIGLEWWLAAIVATVLAFAISYIFFSEPRDALARDIHERRQTADRDADSDIENALLDAPAADDRP